MNIVYLIRKYYYDLKMDMGRTTHGAALAVHGGVNFWWWGDGWPGYDNNLSVQANLNRQRILCDVLIVYKPEDHKGVGDVAAVRAVDFNDCFAPERLADVTTPDARLVIYHHANDLQRFPVEVTDGRCFVHIPHVADKSIFYREDYGERPIDCLLTGVSDETIYPLRCKWKQLIEGGRIPGEIRKFPGYRTKSRTETIEQFHDYAAHLRRAKIVLVCSSVYKYSLAKYVEAIAAGCLVIGDMPEDEYFRNTIGRGIVPVWPHCDEDELQDCVFEWLFGIDAQPAQDRLAIGRDQYLSTATTEHYAQRFVEAAQALR